MKTIKNQRIKTWGRDNKRTRKEEERNGELRVSGQHNLGAV